MLSKGESVIIGLNSALAWTLIKLHEHSDNRRRVSALPGGH